MAETRTNILLVEDNPADARLIAETLKESGSELLELTHKDRLDEALAAMESEHYDVVLLDLSLPDSQGLETMERLRSSHPGVPVVVMTGLDDETIALKAVHSGAQDYIVKGTVDGFALWRSIRYAIEREGLLRALEDSAERLRASETRFRTIVENVADGIIIADIDGIVQFANPSACRIFNAPESEIVGKKSELPLEPDQTKQIELKDRSGQTRIVEIRTVQADFSGEPLYVSSLRDLTEVETLRYLSLVDELTGLFNRRGFRLLANRQLKLARRTKKSAILFFMDIDQLKKINDSLGHCEGDSALVEVARSLEETFRESDIIGRVGGDEFSVLALDARPPCSDSLIQRLNQRLGTRVSSKALPYKLTISIGTAHFDPQNPLSLDDLLARADRDMYKEKSRKRRDKP